MKLTPVSRNRLHSAELAAGFAAILHLLFWIAYPIAYLAEGGEFFITLMAQLGLIPVGLIAFFIVRRFSSDRVVFYAAVLASHIVLSVLFWVLAEPVFGPMITALQKQVGIILTGQPEENYDGLSLLICEILMNLIWGLTFFLTMIAAVVRSEVRRIKCARSAPQNSEKEITP